MHCYIAGAQAKQGVQQPSVTLPLTAVHLATRLKLDLSLTCEHSSQSPLACQS